MVKFLLAFEGCLQDPRCPDGTNAFELAIGSRDIEIASMLKSSPLLDFEANDKLIHVAVTVGESFRQLFVMSKSKR